MHIHQAITQALSKNCFIINKALHGKHVAIEPTDSIGCCYIHRVGDTQISGAPFWNPKAEDLTSDQWELCDTKRTSVKRIDKEKSKELLNTSMDNAEDYMITIAYADDEGFKQQEPPTTQTSKEHQVTEKITKRIASLKIRIELLQVIADNATIAEWLDSWMREPNSYNDKITKLQEEIEILEWVLEE